MQSAILRTGAATAALVLLATAAHAAAPPISGFWRMAPIAKAPKPVLTAKGRAAASKLKINPPDTEKGLDQRCVLQGMPHVMDSAGPVDIIQGATEVLMVSEKLTHNRHIYLDRKEHISEDVFDHTSMGDSLGEWKGDTLHVDTVGFAAGVGPFGAPLTETTHLVESFKLTGDTLTVTSTWSDKATFAKPFTYTLVYHRLPADYTADDFYCDPRKNGFFLPGNLR